MCFWSFFFRKHVFLGMDFRIFFDRHLCDFVSFYLEGQKNAQKMHQPAEEKKRKSVEKTVQAEMGPILRGCQRPKKIKKKSKKCKHLLLFEH